MTLAIGFGANAAAARAAAAGSLAAGLRGRARRLQRRLGAVPRDARRHAPASVRRPRSCGASTSSRCSCSPPPRTRPTAARRSRRRTWRGSGARSRSSPSRRFSGPYHLVWPRDLYHVATAQKAAGDDAAADRLLDYLWQVQKADGSWWQNTFVDGTREVDDRAARPGVAPDRARLVAGPHGRRPTGRTSSGPPTTSSTNGPDQRQGALGEPGRLLAQHDRDRDRRPDLRRRHRAQERRPGKAAAVRGARRRVAAEGREPGPRRTNGPYSPEPYYLRVTKDERTAEPTGTHATSSATTSSTTATRRRPARDRRQLVPRPGAVRRQEVERPDDPQLARGRRRQRRRRRIR